ncbi:hypothetical protein MASR2M8_05850 [Opitutaceae bacterium]
MVEPLEKILPPDEGRRLAEAIPARVRTFMPVAVAVLFLTGALFRIQFSSRPDFFQTRFGLLLTAKVALTFMVLGVFVGAVRASIAGTLDPCRFRYTHRLVAVLILGSYCWPRGCIIFDRYLI